MQPWRYLNQLAWLPLSALQDFKSGQKSLAWIQGKICIQGYHYTWERETAEIVCSFMSIPIKIFFFSILIKSLAV